MLLAFIIIAAIVVGILIYRSGGLRLPAFAGLSGGIMSSSKAKNGAIATLVAIAIIGATLYYWSSTEIVQFGTTYWPWLVGAVVVIVLFWKAPGMATFLGGLLIAAAIIVGTVSLIKDGSLFPKQEAKTVTAQKGGSTVSVGINQPVDLYLSQFTITSHRKDKGVACDLDLTQPFAIRPDGTTRTGEFITVSPLALDRSNGQLYVTITPQSGAYTKEGLQTVDILCYDADPRT